MSQIGRYLGEVVLHEQCTPERSVPGNAKTPDLRALPLPLASGLKLLDEVHHDNVLNTIIEEDLLNLGIIQIGGGRTPIRLHRKYFNYLA